MLRHRINNLLPALALGGCLFQAQNLPQAPRGQAGTPPYRVQIGDVLGVRLYLSADLNEDVTVRPDGCIDTALAQSVPASGRTPEEIAAELRGRYASELKNPELTIEVKTASPSRIFVAGEVSLPGEFTAAGTPLTLLQAIARAGGPRVSGDIGHVIILRHGAGDTPIVLAADYKAAASGHDASADVALAPFDVVYVPKTGIAEIYVWFNQHVQQFVPVSWGFSYNVNPVVSNTQAR